MRYCLLKSVTHKTITATELIVYRVARTSWVCLLARAIVWVKAEVGCRMPASL